MNKETRKERYSRLMGVLFRGDENGTMLTRAETNEMLSIIVASDVALRMGAQSEMSFLKSDVLNGATMGWSIVWIYWMLTDFMLERKPHWFTLSIIGMHAGAVAFAILLYRRRKRQILKRSE